MSYVELHCHSAFSFLDGASLPDELVDAAAGRGPHGAGADRPRHGLGLDGVRPGRRHARAAGDPRGRGQPSRTSRPPPDAAGRATRPAGRNLCRLLTRAHAHTRDTPDRRTILRARGHARRPRGARRRGSSACRGCARQGVRDEPTMRAAACGLRPRRPPRRAAAPVPAPRPRAQPRAGRRSPQRLGVPCVATGNVHAHAHARARAAGRVRRDPRAHDARRLRAAAPRQPQPRADDAARRWRRASPTTPTRSRRPRDWPTGCASTSPRTSATATRAPRTTAPTPSWRQVCAPAFDDRYPRGHRLRDDARPPGWRRSCASSHSSGCRASSCCTATCSSWRARSPLEVRGAGTARALLPPGRGRGSSVSSIVCYLTGLSHVDPIANELFLGRFLNEEITALPDIDLDFPRDVREVLIPRVHERYGRDHSALVAAFPTYRARGAIRELGKALGLPPGEIERVARSSSGWSAARSPRTSTSRSGRAAGRPTRRRAGSWLAALAAEAHGLPRHLSQHSGGMIVATRPLIDCCPVVPAAMEGRQMVMWDKDSCADAGFLKIDLLGLGMLSAVERCVEQIAARRGERIDLSRIPYDDAPTYAAIQNAETTGRLPDREPRADGVAAAHAPGEPRRPHDPGRDRAPGPDPGRRGQPVHRAPAARCAPTPASRCPTTTRRCERAAARHARHDHLPGPGDRGRDGVRRLLARRGRGAAPGDEPQALGGGDRGPPRALRRRRAGAAHDVDERARRARLEDDRRLLGLRLPQGPRRGVRPARLPVDVAAGALRARVPVLAARRAADGLLPARRARPRGPAPRDRGARRPTSTRSAVGCTVTDPRARCGSAWATCSACAPTRSRRSSPSAEASGPFTDLADLASRAGGGRPTLETLAWSGACDELAGGGPHARRAALWALGAAAPGHRVAGAKPAAAADSEEHYASAAAARRARKTAGCAGPARSSRCRWSCPTPRR